MYKHKSPELMNYYKAVMTWTDVEGAEGVYHLSPLELMLYS